MTHDREIIKLQGRLSVRLIKTEDDDTHRYVIAVQYVWS